jgi:DNA-directed RNA polymerase specialized sigma24 family protein
MYMPKAVLRGLLEECQRERTVTSSMLTAFIKIAKHVYSTLGTPHLVDIDDFIQESCLRLMKRLYTIRPEDNVFSYLFELCRLAGHELRAGAFRNERLLDNYIAHIKEVVPGRVIRMNNTERKQCPTY